ncbi:PASTA domain-containing protein [candidate division WOR-3 bacterium]|nr:PASTA domain-containing protein [candidate division WOR-3 bacterium]
MNEKKRSDSSVIWIAVGASAGVALLISAIVSVALNLPGFLLNRPREVPNLVGLSQKAAEELVEGNRFEIVIIGEEPSELEEGLIVKQYPNPKGKLRPGDMVRVILSSGRPTTKVPGLLGQNLIEATEALQAAGLIVSNVVSEHDSLPEDLVIGTDPERGSVVEKGSKVTLFVSLGPDLVEAPSVTNKKLSAARQIIEDAGFSVGEITYQVTTEYYQGIVMRQIPASGDLAPRGSEIDLIVAGVLR